MDDSRRGMALSIKSRLESLKNDAADSGLGDLARFIGLAALAAEDVVLSGDAQTPEMRVYAASNAGHC